jgi:hypothetical protein
VLTNIVSEYLWCDQFQLNLPANARVTGIEVQVVRRASADRSARDADVRLIYSGGATQGRGGAPIPTTMSPETSGGMEDLWGMGGWSVAEINAPSFGVQYSVRRIVINQVTVETDVVRVRIGYVLGPTLTPTLTSSSSPTATATSSPTETIRPMATATPSLTRPSGSPTTVNGPGFLLAGPSMCAEAPYLTAGSPWMTPGNAQQLDGAAAAVDLLGANSAYLRCTGFDLNALPDGATITGIEVLITRKASAAMLGRDASMRLVRQGVIRDFDLAQAAGQPAIPGNYAERSYGGAGQTWGLSWSSPDLKSPDFGVVYAARRSSSISPVSVSVDAVRVRIFYTT